MSGKNNPSPTTQKIMVNLSAPKKSHTFNEKEIPSHKESVKILLNGDTTQSNERNGNSQNGLIHHTKEVIHFHKPLVRTSSNINPVSFYQVL